MPFRAPTLPSIKVPSVVSDAFQMSGGFATKFEESESTEPDPTKSGLIEEEEKYLEAFKVTIMLILSRLDTKFFNLY